LGNDMVAKWKKKFVWFCFEANDVRYCTSTPQRSLLASHADV
jgi:hypothetical protein